MQWERVQSNWKQFRARAKQRWGKLSEQELERLSGDRQQLRAEIQEAYGIGQDEVEQQISEWQATLAAEASRPAASERGGARR
jgi:uncharacterized protein YjbJ (UPF0337 family)